MIISDASLLSAGRISAHYFAVITLPASNALSCFDASMLFTPGSPPANTDASFREINASIRAAYLFFFSPQFLHCSFQTSRVYVLPFAYDVSVIESSADGVRLQK